MKIDTLRTNLGTAARKAVKGGTALAATAFVAGNAMAGELAEAATSAMDKAELVLIGVAVLALCGVIALIRAGKKSAT